MDFRIKTLELLAGARKTEFSEVVLKLISEKRFDELLRIKLSATHLQQKWWFPLKGWKRVDWRYKISCDFRHDYLCAKYLSRTIIDGYSKSEEDMVSECVESFFENERRCKVSHLELGRKIANSTVAPEFFTICKLMGQYLGDLDSKNLDSIVESSGHGPGSTFDISIPGQPLSRKFEGRPAMSPSIVKFARSIMGDRWYSSAFPEVKTWLGPEMCDPSRFIGNSPDLRGCLTNSNKFATVPKTSFKRRPISLEPTLNLFLQKGIGEHLKRRLVHVRNCVRTGQKRNRMMVERAFEDKLATIDLSAASDTISLGVVREILSRSENGRKWLHLLSIARTKCTDVNGKTYELSKLSGMGNGFTFEFETLLFLCVLRSVVPKDEWNDCSSYGDDMICPQKYASRAVVVLNELGFKVNADKTFLKGLFFESCGHDYFGGLYVRPPLAPSITDDVEGGSLVNELNGFYNVISPRIRAANAIRFYSNSIGMNQYCASVYKKAYMYLIKGHDKTICLVPPTLGDSGLVVDLSTSKQRKRNAVGWDGYFVKCDYAVLPEFRNEDFSFLLWELQALPCNNSYLSQMDEVCMPGYPGWFSSKFGSLLTNELVTKRVGFPFTKVAEANNGFSQVVRAGYKTARCRVFVPLWDDSFRWGPRY